MNFVEKRYKYICRIISLKNSSKINFKNCLLDIMDYLLLLKKIRGKCSRYNADLRYFTNLLREHIFNKIVREQYFNYKTIPIIIINFNQLFYLKQLIGFLKKHKYKNIVIIDNNSTYKPLLQYYSIIESEVKIYRLTNNYGHMVFWERKELFKKYLKGYYVVTDPDVVPIEECPEDFIRKFKKKLDRNPRKNKIGFSLKIDDIPLGNINRNAILNWESQFWIKKNKSGDFIASIDTTFALYRPDRIGFGNNFYSSYRTDYPYQAIHGGWYVENNCLTDEQRYYYSTCNESSSWRVDEKGVLIKKEYNI